MIPSGLLACKPIVFVKRISALNVWLNNKIRKYENNRKSAR